MSNYDSLLADAARLPVAERIQLIDAIWETLPASDLPALSPEWTAEIQRRSAEFDAGLAQPIAWEEIRREALRRVGITAPDDSY